VKRHENGIDVPKLAKLRLWIWAFRSPIVK